MSRLPWTNHTGMRGAHDEGGMEHLETDVMRFMAILAFCLVAIFALVQSLPLNTPATAVIQTSQESDLPAPGDTTEPTQTSPVSAPAPTPDSDTLPEPPAAVLTATPAPATTRAPARITTPPPAATAAPPSSQTTDAVVLVMPARPPRPTSRAPATAAQLRLDAATAPAPRGFTLRFDSDQALRQLVAQDAVGLYAFAHDKAWRVMIVNERLSFRPAQVPRQFHEMTAQTVPDDVVSTLRRLVTVAPSQLTWGVTLPTATTRQLTTLLAEFAAGGLIIEADGSLRMEPVS